jgi:hypothetical protein
MPTSKKVARKAGKDLRNPKTPKVDRAPIASDLAQAKNSGLQRALSGAPQPPSLAEVLGGKKSETPVPLSGKKKPRKP